MGADAFIVKPAEPEPFMARIREVLAQAERGGLAPARAPQAEEEILLKEYSETLVRKLEAKALQLEQANRALRDDIARRERAENERRLVLERVSDSFVALDRDWRYAYINVRGAALFGRRPEDLLGKHVWTEFPEGVGQPFHKAYERAMATQQPILLEDFYEPWNRWFENRIYPSPEGLTIFYTEITERKRAENALRNLPRLLLSAQEEERRRIARELHDEIGQLLTAVKLNLQSLQRLPAAESLVERLAESVSLVNSGLSEVRKLALDLRPSILDDLGLAAALRWFVDSQARAAAIEGKLTIEPGLPRLPGERKSPASGSSRRPSPTSCVMPRPARSASRCAATRGSYR